MVRVRSFAPPVAVASAVVISPGVAPVRIDCPSGAFRPFKCCPSNPRSHKSVTRNSLQRGYGTTRESHGCARAGLQRTRAVRRRKLSDEGEEDRRHLDRVESVRGDCGLAIRRTHKRHGRPCGHGVSTTAESGVAGLRRDRGAIGAHQLQADDVLYVECVLGDG